MDYPFASDFYPEEDCRYPLTVLYKSKVKDKTGVSPYNCKISIPHLSRGFYNVNLYFWDMREVFSVEECLSFRVEITMRHKYNYFTLLFNDAIEQCPIKQLNGLKLNPNGVFVEDFRGRSLAYTADNAENELKKLWASNYPQIAYSMRWDSTFYLFFKTMDTLNAFFENDSAKFKNISNDVMSKYDRDGFCSIEAIGFILDLLKNYESIGGYNYFHSDMCNGLKTI
jgi:hypothetical protein